MAKEYAFTIDGHPSIYKSQPRKLKIYFCEPENGVNSQTGILLFIAGFGANANSKVYTKMRSKFADKYNLVTVQCDYFGWEFMQDAEDVTFNFSKSELETVFNNKEINEMFAEGNLDFQKLLRIGSRYNINISCKAKIGENLTNFNDMGIMQAIDNTAAVLAVIAVLNDNELNFNQSKVMLYGHSHGAYLSYLCNAIAPNLFSVLIDNSAWLYPKYLENNRFLFKHIGKAVITTQFEYLAKEVFFDKEILSLPSLYSKFRNNCLILSFHGTTDNLITHIEKQEFCTSISNCVYTEISDKALDGKVFKSTNHGLDADFLELFDYVVTNNMLNFISEKDIQHSVVEYQTSNHKICIDYRHGLPIVRLD